MSKQSISTIQNWFRTGQKPTQAQFWDWLDSFFHKDDDIPSAQVEGLQELLATKMDIKQVVTSEQVGTYNSKKNYVYDTGLAEYVSYKNSESTDEQFQSEGFYRLKEDAPAGENPETNPEHWAYQGGTIGDITIEDVVGLREELDDNSTASANAQSTADSAVSAAADARSAADAAQTDIDDHKNATSDAHAASAIYPDWKEVYIDSDATGNNDGTSWTDAYTDLSNLSDVDSYTKVYIANRTYQPTSKIVLKDKHHIQVLGVLTDLNETSDRPIFDLSKYTASTEGSFFNITGYFNRVENLKFINFDSKTSSSNCTILVVKGDNNLIDTVYIENCKVYNSSFSIHGSYNSINKCTLRNISGKWISGLHLANGYRNNITNIYADIFTLDNDSGGFVIADYASSENYYDNILIENYGTSGHWGYPIAIGWNSRNILFNRVSLKNSKIQGAVIAGFSTSEGSAVFTNSLIENCSCGKSGTYSGIFCCISNSSGRGDLKIINCTTKNNTKMYSLESAASDSYPSYIKAYHCIFTEDTLKHPGYANNIELYNSFTADETITEEGNTAGGDPGFAGEVTVQLSSTSVNAKKTEVNSDVVHLVESGKDLYNFLLQGKKRYPGASQNIIPHPGYYSKEVTLTNSELKSLLSSPVELIPAPGEGKLISIENIFLKLIAGTEALTEADDNLSIRYASSIDCVDKIETTGFIDQLTDSILSVKPKTLLSGTLTEMENKGVEIHNTGSAEFAGNTSEDAQLKVLVSYRINDV
jgi:hypothetical protein